MDLSDQKKLKSLIARRHPVYEEMLPHWQFLSDCYKGGREWFAGNIFRYIKEGDVEYSDRVDRAYRFNHSREIVDMVNKYIFKAEVTRNETDATKAVIDFWRSSTKNDLDISQYMKQVSNRASTFGRIWVVVDNTSAGTLALTLADEKFYGVRTYSYIVAPEHALDMSYDQFGNLNWILISELARDDEDPLMSTGDSINRFRLWTKTSWFLFEERGKGKLKKVELVKQDEHGLGVVPVFSVDHIESSDPYTSPSLIGDIAYLDRAIANYLSNVDAIIQDQTFSQLAMPAQGLLPGDTGFEKLTEMGTRRIFTFDGESGAQPFYLSPDPRQAHLIVTVIQQVINEIYHSVGMAGERTKQDNASGIDNSSGVAKAYDFERVNALLTAKADSLDRAEQKLIHLVNLWNGEESPPVDLVKYADDFDVRGLYDDFDIAERLSLVEAPDSVRREQMNVLVDKLFPRLDEALKKSIINDLKSWPPAPEVLESGSSILNRVPKDKSSNPDGDKDTEAAA
jgi:hypothetical protein